MILSLKNVGAIVDSEFQKYREDSKNQSHMILCFGGKLIPIVTSCVDDTLKLLEATGR